MGPAYSTLIEGIVDGDIVPGEHTILGPSTGNFGIGTAYVSKLLGFRAIVIMPDTMSKERYERIRKYGGELELTPGSESDVILTLEKTRELMKDPKNRALAQFELFPNYRFHRHVTGNSAIEAVKGVGNGRIAGFTSAPGSAGTLAAGDQIKAVFPDAKIAALEPYECSTLANGGRGQHRIEGIGDKMCTLIHNVLHTDFVILIKDEETVQGVKIFHDGVESLVKVGVDRDFAMSLRDLFGPSGICNVLGAIKLAKFLRLGPEDNVVTIATDGFDRYNSVLDDLNSALSRSGAAGVGSLDTGHLSECRRAIMSSTSAKLRCKERLFQQKENDWLKFGYTKAFLDSMRSQDFWDAQYAKVQRVQPEDRCGTISRRGRSGRHVRVHAEPECRFCGRRQESAGLSARRCAADLGEGWLCRGSLRLLLGARERQGLAGVHTDPREGTRERNYNRRRAFRHASREIYAGRLAKREPCSAASACRAC